MLREVISEMSKAPMIFELIVDGETVATNTNADVIERKFKSKKYKNKDVQIMRSHGKDYDDVTDMFK